MVTEADLRAYYDERPVYDSVPASTIVEGMAELEVPFPGTVLDLGSGDGRIVEVFPGAMILGVDYSAARTAIARQRDRGLFLVSPIRPFLERVDVRVDLVTMFEVLEHLEEPRAMLELARRCGPVLGTVPVAWPDPAHLHVWPDEESMRAHLRPDLVVRVGKRWVCYWSRRV